MASRSILAESRPTSFFPLQRGNLPSDRYSRSTSWWSRSQQSQPGVAPLSLLLYIPNDCCHDKRKIATLSSVAFFFNSSNNNICNQRNAPLQKVVWLCSARRQAVREQQEYDVLPALDSCYLLLVVWEGENRDGRKNNKKKNQSCSSFLLVIQWENCTRAHDKLSIADVAKSTIIMDDNHEPPGCMESEQQSNQPEIPSRQNIPPLRTFFKSVCAMLPLGVGNSMHGFGGWCVFLFAK